MDEESRNGGPDSRQFDVSGAKINILSDEYDPTVSLISSNEKWVEDDEVPRKEVGTSSFWQATSNTVALLLGTGMLALPYAVMLGGWSSLALLAFFAIMFCYTGCLLGSCMKENPLLTTYQEIAGSALGLRGRILFTIFFYVEVLANRVGFLISVGDNLARIFPGVESHIPAWIHLSPSMTLASLAMLLISPTALIRDLSNIAYLSFGGIVTSLVVVGAVAWTGTTVVGFNQPIPFANFGKWRFILGLYSYCYAGHPVVPNIHSSMREPSKFPVMLMLSFTIATTTYAGIGLMGASMFGKETLSQITLNIPRDLMAATIVLWTTVLTPLTKFPLAVAPIATELESFLPFDSHSTAHYVFGNIIRLGILGLILAVTITFPYFGSTLNFIGSSITIITCIILPCVFDLVLHWRTIPKLQLMVDIVFLTAATCFAIVGTFSSGGV
ncbi:hypothetical protein R1sor_007983 [Riccia sorocarpa]|uniref:Amino acid transporter transmembrane domain-containing protein n=1 Tax=Riccia sorocarpa TaxID=122646 RepID=A0ABD3HVI4_9MARC